MHEVLNPFMRLRRSLFSRLGLRFGFLFQEVVVLDIDLLLLEWLRKDLFDFLRSGGKTVL